MISMSRGCFRMRIARGGLGGMELCFVSYEGGAVCGWVMSFGRKTKDTKDTKDAQSGLMSVRGCFRVGITRGSPGGVELYLVLWGGGSIYAWITWFYQRYMSRSAAANAK